MRTKSTFLTILLFILGTLSLKAQNIQLSPLTDTVLLVDTMNRWYRCNCELENISDQPQKLVIRYNIIHLPNLWFTSFELHDSIYREEYSMYTMPPHSLDTLSIIFTHFNNSLDTSITRAEVYNQDTSILYGYFPCRMTDTTHLNTSTFNNLIGTKGLKIYPNPTRSSINFKSTVPITQVSLLNASGLVIKDFSGNNIENIDLPDLIPGFYILKILRNNQHVLKSIVIE